MLLQQIMAVSMQFDHLFLVVSAVVWALSILLFELVTMDQVQNITLGKNFLDG